MVQVSQITKSKTDLEWSITDTSKGARTTKEIKEKALLSKRCTVRFSCCRAPLFPFIPMERVVIDTLHLFLRISDVLINLLIRDIRIKDGISKATGTDVPCGSYTLSSMTYAK